MAEEISKPLSSAQKVTMVSSGGAEVGASKLAGEVLDIMTKLPATVEKLTGVDISLVTRATSTPPSPTHHLINLVLVDPPPLPLFRRSQEHRSVRIKKRGTA